MGIRMSKFMAGLVPGSWSGLARTLDTAMPPAVAAGAHGTDGACNRHRGRRISIGMQAAQTIDPAADAAAPERALVEGVLAGMPGAFARLVGDHQGLCWPVSTRMVRPPEDPPHLSPPPFP